MTKSRKSKQLVLDLPASSRRADAGIAAAVANANAATAPTPWAEVALEHLRVFLDRRHRDTVFATEDVRAFAYEQGLAAPPDERAWGGVIRAATKAGVIRASGAYAPSRNRLAHARPVQTYVRGGYR